MAAVEKVFAFAGLTLDEAARSAMRQWEAGNPRLQGGRHVYDGANYGLSGSTVRQAFAAYFDYFADKGVIEESAANR